MRPISELPGNTLESFDPSFFRYCCSTHTHCGIRFVVEKGKHARACIRTGFHACNSVHVWAARVSAQSCLVCDPCHSCSHISMTVRKSMGVLDILCSVVFTWTYAW